MIEIQLYIDASNDDSGDYTRVDLFADESINFTSSIQNIKDISKVFADYSRSFSIPANDNNNKLFKHFYNPDIDGYDATTKKLAKMYLNHMPFREGFVYLDSTEIKNNKAAKYKISFYGGLITLKDKIKDETLISLANKDHWETSTGIPLSIEYNAANVKDALTNGMYSDALIFPLITSEKRLYYDSATSSPNYDGNLYHAGSPDADRGLAFTDLKPAIKVVKIIKAIESKYDISFTGFFDTTPVSNLYLWLSRGSGEIIDYSGDSELPKIKIIDNLVTSAPNSDITVQNDRFVFSQPRVGIGNKGRHYSTFTIGNITGSYDRITLKAIDEVTGEVVGERTESGVTSMTLSTAYEGNTQTGSVAYKKSSVAVLPREYKVRFEVHAYGSNVTFDSEFLFREKKTRKTTFESATYYGFGGQGATGSTLESIMFTDHLPDMKIIDFLSGLFKMFNLTAFVQEPLASTPVIEVKPLDDFYNDAVNNMSQGTIDFTDFIDAESHNVELARPYATVSYNYEETKAVLMEQHETQHKKIFGNTTKDAGIQYNFLGEDYEVKVPFSHLKYERLFDKSDSTLTDIQWGYAAGGDFKHEDATTEKSTPTGNYSPKDIKSLLFYGIQQTITDGKVINWISDTPSSSISTYWRPSNSSEEGTGDIPPANSLNFDSEKDEWQLIEYNMPDLTEDGISANNSLFKIYHYNYIVASFQLKKRIFKYKCFLPAKVLTRYKLNDQIKIHDRLFRINSIKTNLKTGRTELELLNLIPNVDIIL